MRQNCRCHRAQISELAILRSEIAAIFTGEFSYQAPQQSSADLERCLLPDRKRPPGQKHCSNCSVFHRPRLQIFRDNRRLLQLLRRCGYPLADLGKLFHKERIDDADSRHRLKQHLCRFLKWPRLLSSAILPRHASSVPRAHALLCHKRFRASKTGMETALPPAQDRRQSFLRRQQRSRSVPHHDAARPHPDQQQPRNLRAPDQGKASRNLASIFATSRFCSSATRTSTTARAAHASSS